MDVKHRIKETVVAISLSGSGVEERRNENRQSYKEDPSGASRT